MVVMKDKNEHKFHYLFLLVGEYLTCIPLSVSQSYLINLFFSRKLAGDNK